MEWNHRVKISWVINGWWHLLGFRLFWFSSNQRSASQYVVYGRLMTIDDSLSLNLSQCHHPLPSLGWITYLDPLCFYCQKLLKLNFNPLYCHDFFTIFPGSKIERRLQTYFLLAFRWIHKAELLQLNIVHLFAWEIVSIKK